MVATRLLPIATWTLVQTDRSSGGLATTFSNHSSVKPRNGKVTTGESLNEKMTSTTIGMNRNA